MTEVHRIRVFDYTPSPIVTVSLNGGLDNGLLLVGRSNGYIEIWNVRENAFLTASFYVTIKDNLKCAAWCKYRKQTSIVIALLSGELILVDYPSLNSMSSISSGRSDNIFALAVNRSQDKIAIACNNLKDSTGFVSIYAINEDLTFIAKSDNFVSKVLSVCFDHSGNIYAGTSVGIIGKIDPDTGRIVTTYDANSSSKCCIYALTAVPGGCFASGDSNGEVKIWDPNTATVINKFTSHQYEIKALASNDQFLWASGVDPTIVTFCYTKNSNSWSHFATKTRVHDHEVTCLAAAEKNSPYCISGSIDTTFFIKKTIYPFQAPPPVSSAIRFNSNTSDSQLIPEEETDIKDGDEHQNASSLIVAGASGDHQLAVWKLDGKVAKHELTLDVDSEMNRIECVAMCPGGNEFAYSASSVRVLRYTENSHWSYDKEINKPAATSLAYSNNGTLFIGFIDGRIVSLSRVESEDNDNDNESANSSDESSNIVEKNFKLDFPIFKISISSNGNFVAVGGFNNISILSGDLSSKVCDVPPFGSFSTFSFQPFKNRLFIANGGNTISCFNILKKIFIQKANIKIDKSDNEVAINSISFADNNHDQVLISSSQRAIVANVKKHNMMPYILPYKNILFVTFSGYKKIIIFEKPWVLIVSSVPDALRVKHFSNRKEEDRPRYT